tara:strand:+ start:1324 stop:1731 length:408 start_codon:yes stop_codon:yes gene_type:complete
MSKKEQTIEEAKAKIAAAKAKLANLAAPASGGCGASPNVVITRLKFQVPVSFLPRQVQLILGYLEALGGTATVGEVSDLGDVATGAHRWCKSSGEEYDQDTMTSLDHYAKNGMLEGNRAWTAKKCGGKHAILKFG